MQITPRLVLKRNFLHVLLISTDEIHLLTINPFTSAVNKIVVIQ
jgi:hypothetical protein